MCLEIFSLGDITTPHSAHTAVCHFIIKIIVFSLRNSFSSSIIWWGYSSTYIELTYLIQIWAKVSRVFRGRSQTTFTKFGFFYHLPPSVYFFYGMKVYIKSIFLTTYPPPLVNVGCERPLNKNTDKQNRCAISLHKSKSQRIYYHYLSNFLTLDIFRNSKIISKRYHENDFRRNSRSLTYRAPYCHARLIKQG